MKSIKTQNGITLVALVITVIVLLILAGTAVSIAINGENLFGKASQARNSWNIEVAKEEQEVNSVLQILNTITTTTGNTQDSSPTPTVTTATSKQWEFASGGDKDSSGTVSLGDIIRPKNANISSEEFYVINTSDSTTYTLLAKTLVKVSSGNGRYTTQVGTTSEAGTLAFRSDSSAANANIYSASDIKEHAETYANHLAQYVTLENVETVEGEAAVSGVKGRLMWGTTSSGEVKALLDAGFTDLLYGTYESELNYWLGSPCTVSGYDTDYEWYIWGNSYLYDNNTVDWEFVGNMYIFGLRPVIKILKSNV